VPAVSAADLAAASIIVSSSCTSTALEAPAMVALIVGLPATITLIDVIAQLHYH
jgi:hypothetical protein